MAFERIGDSLASKDIDKQFDIIAFYSIVRKVIKHRSGIDIDSVSLNNHLLRVSVSHPVEASEIRLRKIQIEREIIKRTQHRVDKILVRVSS